MSRHTAVTVRAEIGVGNDPNGDPLEANQRHFEGDRLFFYGVSVGILLVL